MAKVIEYDVTGVEESTGGTGVKVKPGVHPARIAKCVQRTQKKNGEAANDIEVALDFGAEYDWGFTYIGLGEAADWKLAEFIRALDLKDKGKLDPEKMVGKIIRVKVNHGEYEGNYSPDIGKLMKAQPGDEELIGQQVSEMSSRSTDGPEDDEAAQGGGPHAEDTAWRENRLAPDGSGETLDSYDEWTDEDLEAEVTDRSLTLPAGRSSKKNKMVAALREDDNKWDEANNGGEPESGGSGTTDGSDDYDEWDVDRLKQEWNDRNFGELPEVRGRGAAERLKQAIVDELRKDDKDNPFEG